MQTALAPKAKALNISEPRLNPLSTKTGILPPTASTTSGKLSIVARPLSSARPPWFYTMMPSTPCSMLNCASSRVTIPFSTTFMSVVFFDFTVSATAAVDGP